MKYFKINSRSNLFYNIYNFHFTNYFNCSSKLIFTKLINKFYKKNIGLENGEGIKGIQSGLITNIIKIINQNNLKKYKLLMN